MEIKTKELEKISKRFNLYYEIYDIDEEGEIMFSRINSVYMRTLARKKKGEDDWELRTNKRSKKYEKIEDIIEYNERRYKKILSEVDKIAEKVAIEKGYVNIKGKREKRKEFERMLFGLMIRRIRLVGGFGRVIREAERMYKIESLREKIIKIK